MAEQAEQMVLEYLSKVGEAAYGNLPSRRRTAYLAELRSRIDNACASAQADTPDQVRHILQSFGDPAALVARECGGETETEAVEAVSAQDGGRDNTHRPAREPPPWRGGRDPGWLGAGFRPPRQRSGGLPASALVTAVRRHPPEVLSIAVYLLSGAIGAVAAAWIVGAVLVVLSRVWDSGDKWTAVGGPIAATLLGMLLWQGEEPYIDQIIVASFLDTGVIGLQVAALGCALYLVVRIARIAGAES